LSGFTDKRLSSHILIPSGSLADKQEPRTSVSDTEHQAVPGGPKGTAPAVTQFAADIFHRLLH